MFHNRRRNSCRARRLTSGQGEGRSRLLGLKLVRENHPSNPPCGRIWFANDRTDTVGSIPSQVLKFSEKIDLGSRSRSHWCKIISPQRSEAAATPPKCWLTLQWNELCPPYSYFQKLKRAPTPMPLTGAVQ